MAQPQYNSTDIIYVNAGEEECDFYWKSIFISLAKYYLWEHVVACFSPECVHLCGLCPMETKTLFIPGIDITPGLKGLNESNCYAKIWLIWNSKERKNLKSMCQSMLMLLHCITFILLMLLKHLTIMDFLTLWALPSGPHWIFSSASSRLQWPHVIGSRFLALYAKAHKMLLMRDRERERKSRARRDWANQCAALLWNDSLL